MRRTIATLKLEDHPIIGSITLQDEEFKVWLNDDANFCTEVDATPYSAPSLAGLTAKIKTVNKSVKVSIPLMRISYADQLEPVVVIGIHEGNGNILLRKADGTLAQAYGNHEFCRLFTPEEMQQLKQLKAAEKRAEKAVTAFLDQRKVNAKQLIREAQARAKL